MGVTYFKRYRMEIDLTRSIFPEPFLPDDYHLVAWNDSLLEAHSEAKFRSFRFEIDANVFPCLGDPEGCYRLMREISMRDCFLKEATWLLQYRPSEAIKAENCGTIQGIYDSKGLGAVQNIGVTPQHRGLGLGTYLLHHALLGFQSKGLERSYLEVTSENSGAVRLYERLGFSIVKTVYKPAEVAFA